MKNVGRTISRHLRSSFTKRTNPLPRRLEFLQGLPFYSIFNYCPPGNNDYQTRVDFTVRGIKKISLEAKKSKDLRRENLKLNEQVGVLECQLSTLRDEMAGLQAANEQLMHNLKHFEALETRLERSPVTIFKKAEVIKYFKVPYQGGLPSLGKRR